MIGESMISVIIPYRNAAQWLDRCIESLKKQSESAEFILINDNSTDESEDIVRKHAGYDDRIRMFRNSNIPGVSGARNTGLENAHGERVTFLDADDEMTVKALSIYKDVIAKDPAAKMHMANHLRHYAKHNKTVMKYANEAGYYSLKRLPILYCMVWNKVYSREMIESHNIRFDERMRYGEDEIFNLECLAADSKILHAPIKDATIIRHFDNRQSLCHIKDESDLFEQSDALIRLIRKYDDPVVRSAICRIIGEHWNSKTYLQIIGKTER